MLKLHFIINTILYSELENKKFYNLKVLVWHKALKSSCFLLQDSKDKRCITVQNKVLSHQVESLCAVQKMFFNVWERKPDSLCRESRTISSVMGKLSLWTSSVLKSLSPEPKTLTTKHCFWILWPLSLWLQDKASIRADNNNATLLSVTQIAQGVRHTAATDLESALHSQDVNNRYHNMWEEPDHN